MSETHIRLIAPSGYPHDRAAMTRGVERLQAAGCWVDGLDVLEREDPHLVITDINMPKMDGFGFIEGARRIDRFRVVPILVLTTESDADKKQRARSAGATGWIVKPFDPVKLVDVIRRVAA